MKQIIERGDVELLAGGVAAVGAYKISDREEDVALLSVLLRQKLYLDPTWAAVREVVSNAIDAHDAVGQTRKVNIHFPTSMDPTFRVRDYGPGLSEEDVLGLYLTFGSSTKRNSDSQIGGLGLGCKAPLAYAESMSVESHHGGVKKTYMFFRDLGAAGQAHKVAEEPTTETGIEVSFAVKQVDTHLLQTYANRMFLWREQLQSNVEIPSIPEWSQRGDYMVLPIEMLRGTNCSLHVAMGGIVYPLLADKLLACQDASQDEKDKLERVLRYLSHFNQKLVLLRSVGFCPVSPSRENLEYTKKSTIGLLRALLESTSGIYTKTREEFVSMPLWQQLVMSFASSANRSYDGMGTLSYIQLAQRASYLLIDAQLRNKLNEKRNDLVRQVDLLLRKHKLTLKLLDWEKKAKLIPVERIFVASSRIRGGRNLLSAEPPTLVLCDKRNYIERGFEPGSLLVVANTGNSSDLTKVLSLFAAELSAKLQELELPALEFVYCSSQKPPEKQRSASTAMRRKKGFVYYCNSLKLFRGESYKDCDRYVAEDDVTIPYVVVNESTGKAYTGGIPSVEALGSVMRAANEPFPDVVRVFLSEESPTGLSLSQMYSKFGAKAVKLNWDSIVTEVKRVAYAPTTKDFDVIDSVRKAGGLPPDMEAVAKNHSIPRITGSIYSVMVQLDYQSQWLTPDMHKELEAVRSEARKAIEAMHKKYALLFLGFSHPDSKSDLESYISHRNEV